MINIAKPDISDEEKKAVIGVLESGMIAQGPKVKELEEKFAKFCNTKHAIAVSSGTAALHTAIHAVGIKEGDEVITTPFTFVATANTILMQRAKPIFVDINENDFNIDINKIKEKITNKTKAIIPVDLYGNLADYDALNNLAKEHGIKIIADACQSHGAELNNIKSGKLADISCFSLYATKNMTCGEGGIITTDNDEYAEKCRKFRHHGQSKTYEYDEIGYNYRLTDIQAAIALIQLTKLEDNTKTRIKYAQMFNEGLKDIKGIILPQIKDNIKHVFHQYTIRCDNVKVKREELIEHLKKNDINASIFYPKPLHLHPHFYKMGYKKGDFPVSETISRQVISLPIHPLLTVDEINKIINVVRDFCQNG